MSLSINSQYELDISQEKQWKWEQGMQQMKTANKEIKDWWKLTHNKEYEQKDLDTYSKKANKKEYRKQWRRPKIN